MEGYTIKKEELSFFQMVFELAAQKLFEDKGRCKSIEDVRDLDKHMGVVIDKQKEIEELLS